MQHVDGTGLYMNEEVGVRSAEEQSRRQLWSAGPNREKPGREINFCIKRPERGSNERLEVRLKGPTSNLLETIPQRDLLHSMFQS